MRPVFCYNLSMWSRLSAKTKSLALGVIIIFTMIALVQMGEIIWYGSYCLNLKKTTVSFSGGVAEKGNILIIGDSTGVGVGADKPEDSIAGFLVEDGFKVKNLSEDGAITKEVFKQIENENVIEGKKYDLVLIFSGGNDIMWFSNLNETILFFDKILDKAKEIGKKVVVMPPGNVGLAPIFREPVGLVFTNRTSFMREFFMKISEEKGVLYVDLFANKLEELFLDSPLDYFAQDLIHPSSKGYELWYLKMRDKLAEEGVWW